MLPSNHFPNSQAPLPDALAVGTLWVPTVQNNHFPSRHWTSMIPSELLYDLNISQLLTGLRHITKPLSVITELTQNSHWWFSWKRSHLNILNHPLPISNLFWNYTSVIRHPHAACRTSLFPCQWFRQREVVPYFPRNAVIRVLSPLFKELI